MAERTKISWTDSTFNPWIGCTKVGPGCDHCYAEAMDSRRRWDGGKTHWGAGVPRYRTGASNWAQPLAWNRKAEKDGEPHRVFCASLADVFDNEVPQIWRHDLWKLIVNTPHLEWLIVTKRIGNVAKMWPVLVESPPPNVRLLITVVNQEEADRDIPKLLALPCKNGISYEPALAEIDWQAGFKMAGILGTQGYKYPLDNIDWIIIGGESAQAEHKARPFDLAWARSTIAQCRAASVPCFVKQLGSNPVRETIHHDYGRFNFKDRAGADPAEWPEDLRVREFPE